MLGSVHESRVRVHETDRQRLTRADRVLEALHQFASGGIVCRRPGEIARSLDVSVDTVQRGIVDLADGRLEDTGLRTGKARAYRIVEGETPQAVAVSPQLSVASPQAAAQNSAAGEKKPPIGGASSPAASERRRGFVGSPADAADKAYIESWKPDPDRLTHPEYLAATRWYQHLSLEGLEPVTVAAIGLEPLGPGPCDDCPCVPPVRSRYGRYELCQVCVGRRTAAGLKLASSIGRATTAADERDLPTPPTRDSRGGLSTRTTTRTIIDPEPSEMAAGPELQAPQSTSE
jgi:hypothetical protein